jgi:hypothetical protein
MSEEMLARIFERQGETNAKLDRALERLDDHAKRISRMERYWAPVLGVLAAIGTGASLAVRAVCGNRKG